jgi:hypothetical protein
MLQRWRRPFLVTVADSSGKQMQQGTVKFFSSCERSAFGSPSKAARQFTVVGSSISLVRSLTPQAAEYKQTN